MAWTKVTKISGTGWTKISVSSKYTYDDISLIYDSPSVQYDGAGNSWTNILKPSGTSWTNIAKPT